MTPENQQHLIDTAGGLGLVFIVALAVVVLVLFARDKVECVLEQFDEQDDACATCGCHREPEVLARKPVERPARDYGLQKRIALVRHDDVDL